MPRFRSFAAATLVLALIAPLAAQQPATPAAPAAAAGLTAADAAPFLGDWTLTMESPMGPMALGLAIKTDAGKVIGEISSDMMPKTVITMLEKNAASLVLRYDFNYEGNAVPVVVTLTPSGDKVGAAMDFAGGAFQMAGAATQAK